MKRKLLSVLLSALLLLGALPLSASAAEAVSYWTWDSVTQTLVEKTDNDACQTYTTVESGTTAWDGRTTGGWYVVSGEVTITDRITVTGNVHLILMDGSTLTAQQGIQVQDDDDNVGNGSANSLTIYAQSTDQETMGSLSAQGGWGESGIGGAEGDITISGGNVTAQGGSEAAGIGGGSDRGENGTFSTGEGGKAVIFANKISDQSRISEWSGIIFEGNNGKVYGNETLTENFEIPEEKALEIEDGKPLTVANGVTLTNSGGLVINGTLTIDGTLINKGRISGIGKILPEMVRLHKNNVSKHKIGQAAF